MSDQTSAPVKPNPYGVAPLNLSQTMQERRNKRRVDEKVYGVMPDYGKEPAQWEVRMTKRIKGLAGSFGYSVYASGEIVKATWDRAKERGWMGDTAKVLLVAKGVIARRERAKRQQPASDLETRLKNGERTVSRDELHEAIQLITDGKIEPVEGVDFVRMPVSEFTPKGALPVDPKRPTEPLATTIERFLHEKYKAQNPQVVRRIMKEARVNEAFRRDEDILTDLCAVAETTFFKPAADHWMSKPGEARNFYRYLHILASDVPLMERIQRANIALGNVYSPCNYAGSLGEAKAALEAEFKPKTPVLDETFKREDDAEPVEDETVATPATKTTKSNEQLRWPDDPKQLAKFWGKVNGQLNEFPAWRALSNGGGTGQVDFVHETIGSRLHDTELDLDECADFVIEAGRETYGVDEEKAKAEKSANDWSQDTNKVMALIEKLKPIAARLDIAEDHIVNEACHALKIGAWSEFVGTGKEFYDDLCAIWKPAERPAQDTKRDVSEAEHTEAATDAPAAKSEPQTSDVKRNPFKPASFESSFLRMALVGPSGSGKTYTALKVGTNLIPNGRVALIDTERGSASKYAKLFKFDVLELRNYHPDTYIKAINAAVENGYDVLVIDSLTHAWNGDGGILSIVDKQGGGFDKWKNVNPILYRLIDTILDSQIHLIATMRTKTDYVMEVNERGKTSPRKVGLAPIQKEGIEYEFDIYAEIDLDSTMTISKSRCPDLTMQQYPKAGAEVAKALSKWLSAA